MPTVAAGAGIHFGCLGFATWNSPLLGHQGAAPNLLRVTAKRPTDLTTSTYSGDDLSSHLIAFPVSFGPRGTK